jgi:glutathione synthase/RimK-type ligase-like ATP-grasp enzyme
MIEISRKLSTSLPFVRVDLYEVNNQVYFGELTLYPQNGFSSFYPIKYEREFGKLINLENYQSYTSRFYKNPSFTKIYRLRYYLSKFKLFETLVIGIKKRRGDFIDDSFNKYFEQADKVYLPEKNRTNLPRVGLVKDIDNYSPLIQKRSHWPKYQRFLENNNIPFSFYNIHDSDWMEKAKDYDLIIFRPDNSPSKLQEAKSKIYIIEHYLKIKCFPKYDEIWSYEDKVRANYLYRILDIPHVKTYITHNKTEALKIIKQFNYPMVSKISCGSVSRGVSLLKSKKQAEKLVRKVFSTGKLTYWSEYKQKNYIYLQEFIHDAIYDLRIIVVGNRISGYYRLSQDQDFRASGSGIWQCDVSELPEEAMKIAIRLKEAINSTILAVDMIKSEESDQFLVIEHSIFYDVDYYEELVVNGVAGHYHYYKKDGDLKFVFKPGKFWIQELIAKELITQYQASDQ